MLDLGRITQEAVLDRLASVGKPEALLQTLQSSFGVIRQSYRGKRPPPFSDSRVRAAYALGYFPHHAALAASAYAAAGSQMLGLKNGASVVVLGAGPGPEVVGLAQYLAQSNQAFALDIHLVDREAGWRETRAATIDTVLERIDGFERSSFRIHAYEHDLGVTEGIHETASLLATADLVVMETLLTELPSPEKDGHLVDWLIDRLPHEGRLLFIDLDRVRQHSASQSKLVRASHLRPRLSSKLSFPAASPLPVIRENLFPQGEYPRKSLNAEIELYSRPDCVVLPIDNAVSFELNAGQKKALQQLKQFFTGTERIFVLTGAAGTGKSALLPAIVSLAQETGVAVELMAPTGQAARRVADVSTLGASTVHATIYTYAGTRPVESSNESGDMDVEFAPFELSGNDENDETDKLPVSVFELREPPREPAVYVVDEASLIGNRPLESDEPEVVFGRGTLLSDLLAYTLDHPESRIVFVGDAEQLPPVGEHNSPALESDSLNGLSGTSPVLASLTQVMRQDETSGILDLAHRARSATIRTSLDVGPDDPEAGINVLGTDSLPGWMNDALVVGDAVVVAARNADVARWNTDIRRAVDRPIEVPVRGDLVSVLRRDAQTNLRIGDQLTLEDISVESTPITIKGEALTLRDAQFRFDAVGAGPVFFEAPFVKDLLYQASAADQQRVTRLLYIDFKMRHESLKPNTEAFDAAYDKDPRVNALRICYAYARTCHRAQGGEWRQVVVDFRGSRWLGPSFGRWSYTAVTRTRKSVWLANLVPPRSVLGADFLVEGAAAALAEASLVVSAHHPIQHGVQLEITSEGDRLLVDLYEKKGRPSRPVPRGGHTPKFTERALEALESWIKRERASAMDPLPDRLEQTLLSLGTRFQDAGYDLSMQPYADYEVEVMLQGTNGGVATAICSYKGDGRITSIKSLIGELQLQQRLRESLESAVP
jgi:exodeoxyribonuclease V